MEWLLRTDNLTYAFGAVAAGVYLATKWMEPVSMVPPLILGRQSDASRTRQPNESPVYRNYGTGFMSPILPARPHRDVQTVNDLLKVEHTQARSLWGVKITNVELKERVAAFASGLAQTANLTPRSSRVLLLLNDSLEWLIADFALAALAVPSITLASLTVLSDLLDQHTPTSIIVDASFLEQLLELIAEEPAFRQHAIVVVGQVSNEAKRSAQIVGVTLASWEDVLAKGSQNTTDFARPEPTALLSVIFSRTQNNEIQATQFTHENFTAGVVATHFLLPYQNALSPKDSVVSAYPLATAFGRSVLYSALYNGASFITTGSSKVVSIADTPARDLADILTSVESQRTPSPTVLFLTRQHLNSLTKAILAVVGGPLKPLAWRHKSAALAAGSLTNDTLSDTLVFRPARRAALGQMATTLRAVVVAGDVDAATLPAARIALSMPVVHAYAHPVAAGAVFGSHPLDVQSFPLVDGDALSSVAHVGPPTSNMEVKLVNIGDEDSGKPLVGNLHLRGPTIGTDGLGDLRPSGSQQWVDAGETAAVQTNGSFKVVPASF